jgi:hypothetical protein
MARTRAGRPEVPKKRQNEVFCVRMDPDVVSYLRALAERERRPVAMQLAVIVEDYRRRNGDSSAA